MKYWSVILSLLASCNSKMAYERQILNRYYLVATDTRDQLSISRELENGDYIGRIPGKVQSYAVLNDTLIFARTTTGYYILNTRKDHDLAEVKDVVIGPLDQATFMDDWSSKYIIKLTSPE